MLPVLNIAKQQITIPFLEKKFTIRPYLVGEEKGLLIAVESKDPENINLAVKNIIKSCIEENISVDDLSSFEIEYIFLQLRKMSVNNISEIGLNHKDHSECKHVQKVIIDLDKVQVKGSTENKILLDPIQKIGVVMRPPRMKDTAKKYNTDTEKAFGIIQNSIESIYDATEIYHTNQVSEKEMSEWLNQLNSTQLKMITDYIENLPTLYYDVEYKCDKCGLTEKITIEGLVNFL